MVSGSSIKFSVWMVPQRQKLKDHEFSMYFSEMVPQACLRCLRLFSCLLLPDNIFQRWKRCYTGPGKFLFAVTGADKLYAFTDHSFFIFLSDGTPYESVLLDGPACDAGKLAICQIYNE